MKYKLSLCVDYYFYRAICGKADRMGLSLAQILRMALSEYLERNPKENEQEEWKKYYPTEENSDAD